MKIVSDGRVVGTRILNDDGTMVDNVSRIEIIADAKSPFVTAVVTFDRIRIDDLTLSGNMPAVKLRTKKSK